MKVFSLKNANGRTIKTFKDHWTAQQYALLQNEKRGKYYSVVEQNTGKILPRSAKINIKANTWFDGVNGNTYHKVYIFIETGRWMSIWESPITYGYGDHWLETAWELIWQKCQPPKAFNPENKNWDRCRREFWQKYHTSVYEVKRKKDL